jgi:pSer/pThr/pTyr-binding forkhead associated (FHA) protein
MSTSQVSKSTVIVTRPKLATQELHLVFVNTPRAGELIHLGPSLRIGKAPDNDVVIDHPTVSRNHLVVRRQQDQFLCRTWAAPTAPSSTARR